jgi:hypothetical protein
MTVIINGTTGITNDGGYTGDGIVFANTTPSNTLVTTTAGNVGIGTSSPVAKLDVLGTSRYYFSVSNAYTLQASVNPANTVFVDDYKNALSHTWQTNGTDQARITSTGLFQFNSGYGSVATAYGCRAWVNFNGIDTVSIRTSGNVSSITDNGTGLYSVNFTTSMPDANYTCFVANDLGSSDGWSNYITLSTGNASIGTRKAPGVGTRDTAVVSVAIFR